MKATSKQVPELAGEGVAQKSEPWRSSVIIVLGLVLVVAVAAGSLFAYQHYFAATKSSEEKVGDLSDVDYVMRRVSRHMELPSDETPALLTVTDNAKLTSSFLRQAKNGDKVLVYQTNKKAILYRPSIDRIVDVGPVVIDAVKQ